MPPVPADGAVGRCGGRRAAWFGAADRGAAAAGTRPRTPQCVRRHQRRNPAGAEPDSLAADSPDARGGRYSAPRNPDPRGHRPAPAELGRRVDRDGRPLGGRELSDRESSRPAARRAHLSRSKSPRRARLDRLALCSVRVEGHDRADRAASDGRFLRRAKIDLPGPGRLGNRTRLARPRFPRTSQRPRRLSRWQPGPRREHGHRANGGLRLHRQRGDRRPTAHSSRRGRRHGGRLSRRRGLRSHGRRRHAPRAGRRRGDDLGRLSVGCDVLSVDQRAWSPRCRSSSRAARSSWRRAWRRHRQPRVPAGLCREPHARRLHASDC